MSIPLYTPGGECHHPEITHVLSQLKSIRLASGILLQAINRSVLHNTALDSHSQCWLSGKEPKGCLETLQRMEEDWAKARAVALPGKDRAKNIISMFLGREGFFRFLLELDLG